MELMTSEKINNEVGKEWFLADDNTLAAKLIYISGIKGFDEYLGDKDQYDLGTVIHIKEKPNGIILRLAKNFSAKETAINYKNIKQISLLKLDRYSIIKIYTFEETIYFGLDNYDTYEVANYFKGLKKIIFDENAKFEIPKQGKEKFESILIKNTDILPINIDKIVASKTKRFFNFFIDTIFINIIGVPFLIDAKFVNPLQQILSSLIIPFLYYIIMEGTFRTTFGKLMTNTKVMSYDGSRADDIFIRTICRFIPFDQLSFLFCDKGWHDSISKTIVIDKGLRKKLLPTRYCQKRG